MVDEFLLARKVVWKFGREPEFVGQFLVMVSASPFLFNPRWPLFPVRVCGVADPPPPILSEGTAESRRLRPTPVRGVVCPIRSDRCGVRRRPVVTV